MLTEPLSQEAKESGYLFYLLSKPAKNTTHIKQRYKPRTLESGKWTSTILRPFLERNGINTSFINSQGKKVKVTSHCFRHTFAHIAVVTKNVNLKVIQTHYKHLSIEMTSYYLALSKKVLKENYIQGMLTSNLYTQGKEGERFKALIEDIRVTEHLDKVLEKLSKLFGINPLPFGLCFYDFKRGHCPNLEVQSCYMVSCGDFVTNRSFLPYFEHEEDLLNKQLAHTQRQGYTVEEKKARFRLQKVQSITKQLKENSHAKG